MLYQCYYKKRTLVAYPILQRCFFGYNSNLKHLPLQPLYYQHEAI